MALVLVNLFGSTLLPSSAIHLPAFSPSMRQPACGCRLSWPAMVEEEGGGDFFAAFAAKRAEEKEKEREANRKPGQGAAKKADVQGLPIRLGGTTRDGSLGDVRAGWEQFVRLNPKEWESEEFGLLGIFALTAISIIWGYNTAFAENVMVEAPIPTTDSERALYSCLADAFGNSEKLACNIKYGFGK